MNQKHEGAVRRVRVISLLIVVISSLTVCARPRLTIGQLTFERQHVELNVEIAETAKMRELGLMYRDELAADAGMLFVFPNESVLGVWMKNTLVPLDILFISEAGEVVSWLQHVSPCGTDPCPVYYSEVPARYMLEVNAGFIKHEAIKRGDRVSIVR